MCFKPHSVIRGRPYTHKQTLPIKAQFTMASLIPAPQETPTLAFLIQLHLQPDLFFSLHTPLHDTALFSSTSVLL